MSIEVRFEIVPASAGEPFVGKVSRVPSEGEIVVKDDDCWVVFRVFHCVDAVRGEVQAIVRVKA